MHEEKPFSIRLDGSVRVGELTELAGSASITRTPHLGNLYPADLALMSLGIPVRLLDKNCSVVDRLFMPEARIIDATPTVLSSRQGVLTPYLATSAGQAVVFEHFHTTQAAVPGSTVSTYSLDYLQHIDLVEAVLGIMAEVSPGLFNRLSLADGQVARQRSFDTGIVCYDVPQGKPARIGRRELASRCIRYFEEVADCLRSGTPVQTGGHVLISAEADILLQGLVDTAAACGERRQRVYQCCGLPMARYATDPRRDMAASITDIYRKVKRRLAGRGHALPDIEMILVPTSMLRLVYLGPEKSLLHRQILDSEERLLALKHSKGEDIRGAKNKSQVLRIIDRYQALFQRVRDERQVLIEKQMGGKWPPFYLLGDCNRFTQYDLAASGESITIPDDLLDLPVKALAPRIKKLLAAYPRLRQAMFC